MPETMNAASPSLRERFQQFMPTPGLTRQPMSGPRPSPLAPSMSGPKKVVHQLLKVVLSQKVILSQKMTLNKKIFQVQKW
ncbi:hypothetical protein AHAS_Ahas13G0276600 [Arachis hypogaea]